MSGGEIRMLATVSESTYTRLYRELAALPERKRVKRLIVLAQIGQIAEMAAMGHQLLPASDLPSPVSTVVAAPAAAAAAAPKPTTPEPQSNASISTAPEPTLVEKIDQASPPQPASRVIQESGVSSGKEMGAAEQAPQNHPEIYAASAPTQGPPTPRKPRRSAHAFKVDMTKKPAD